MKHVITKILVSLVFALAVGTLQAKPPKASGAIKYEDVSTEIISTIAQMIHSERYTVCLIGGQEELNSAVKAIREESDFSRVKNVYQISDFENYVENVLTAQDSSYQQMDENLLRNLTNTVIEAFTFQLDASDDGVVFMALTNLYEYVKLFVDESLKKPMLHLYDFGGKYNIAIVYTPLEDGIVSAQGRLTLQGKKLYEDDSLLEYLRVKMTLIK